MKSSALDYRHQTLNHCEIQTVIECHQAATVLAAELNFNRAVAVEYF
jgi:hypothetical protein